ncbi:hypothetical protein ABFV05_015428 [Capra hircus]
MGSIKDRNGMDLTEAEDIKKRWQEYTEELYKKDLHDQDNHDGVITHLEPDILECEVKWALESITTNKARGGDDICAQKELSRGQNRSSRATLGPRSQSQGERRGAEPGGGGAPEAARTSQRVLPSGRLLPAPPRGLVCGQGSRGRCEELRVRAAARRRPLLARPGASAPLLEGKSCGKWPSVILHRGLCVFMIIGSKMLILELKTGSSCPHLCHKPSS